jgi:hypothetical protein
MIFDGGNFFLRNINLRHGLRWRLDRGLWGWDREKGLAGNLSHVWI